MLFNSFTFLLFFIIVFLVYWFPLKHSIKKQNIFILISSYVFYAWWDWRFLGLIVASTLIDFFIGRSIKETTKEKNKKSLLFFSIIFNLGILGFFKYYNFFIENWIELWQSVGIESNLSSINIILPVGISFYTFQTLSYTIDIYRGKIEPSNSLLNFATFVAFFPQLVAGPIERASHLLPQLSVNRKFNYEFASSGIYLIVWGFFKKVVIADSCATYVNVIFDNYEEMNSFTLILGAIYFGFQIYGDFSGYSDMAIGLSRLLGFNLKPNFNKPYFARDIAEFWRRWHISLSTWFRDYLYIPLGGSRGTTLNKINNVFIIFLISGLWHGANWTFVFWGILNALFFLPLLLFKQNRNNLGPINVNLNWVGIKTIFQILITFLIVSISWIFFRSISISDAFLYLKRIFANNTFTFEYLSIERYNFEVMLLVTFFISIEWIYRNYEYPFIGKYKNVNLLSAIVLIFVLGVFSKHTDFIYFQF